MEDYVPQKKKTLDNYRALCAKRSPTLRFHRFPPKQSPVHHSFIHPPSPHFYMRDHHGKCQDIGCFIYLQGGPPCPFSTGERNVQCSILNPYWIYLDTIALDDSFHRPTASIWSRTETSLTPLFLSLFAWGSTWLDTDALWDWHRRFGVGMPSWDKRRDGIL